MGKRKRDSKKHFKVDTKYVGVVPADSSLWSEKSKNSYSFGIKEYKDIEYLCWHCKKSAVFGAKDQKYTYEIRKAHICQQRVLCSECWKESLQLESEISGKESQWEESKSALKRDKKFLSEWLELLERQEQYIRYKPNTAIKNMLKKLLNSTAD